jgi:hypothetical protein
VARVWVDGYAADIIRMAAEGVVEEIRVLRCIAMHVFD